MVNTIEVENMDKLAETIRGLFSTWDDARTKKKEQWEEVRAYLYATDTQTTANNQNNLGNTTTIPKMTQIKDNLKANYIAALFPNDDWLDWKAGSPEGLPHQKKTVMKQAMKDKTDRPQFRNTMDDLVDDWITYGNAIASVEFVKEEKVDEDTGEVSLGFVGPVIVRHSPEDVVFNPLAESFESSPKIIRKFRTVGDLYQESVSKPEQGLDMEVVAGLMKKRKNYAGGSTSHRRMIRKGFSMEGFGNLDDYYQSGYMEILEFSGDVFDLDTMTLHKNLLVSVIDRNNLLRKTTIDSWNNEAMYKHIGWRKRADNLWAMGPLDGLVGMQYRLDHSENMKADLLDQTAHPLTMERGDVDFDGLYPGAKVTLGEGADFKIINVDSQALSYDSQMGTYMTLMEQLAGAPSEAMGIRSPGEKTAYEVQQLSNNANKMFQSKVNLLEEFFLEPLVNQMAEVYRRNLNMTDSIRLFNDETKVESFLAITRHDLAVKGSFYPRGARHFAERARFVQEATQFLSGIGADPAIKNHISGKVIAKAFVEAVNLDKVGAYEENVAIYEQLDSQRIINAGQQAVGEEDMVSTAPNVPSGVDEESTDPDDIAIQELMSEQQMETGPNEGQ
jgi:hypothetical protein